MEERRREILKRTKQKIRKKINKWKRLASAEILVDSLENTTASPLK